MQVAVAEGKDQYVEAVGELHEDRLDGQSGDGMPPEAGDGLNGSPPKGAAGVDAHFEQVAGNGQVADPCGPLTGSISGFVEASATQTVGNPVPAIALPAQPLSVSGAYAHAPVAGAMPGVWSRLPDPSELYALPRMPYPHMGYPPAPVGRISPAPITAAVRTTVMTTITSTVAVFAVQTGLVYTSFSGPRAPTSGTYAIRPMYRAADHQYYIGSTFEDPRGVGIYSYPGTGQAEVGAIGGVPVGAVGYPEPSGCPEQGSRDERTGAIPRCEQVTVGGYGAQPREARTTGYYGYTGVPADVVHADQAMVSGHVGFTGQAIAAGYREPGGHVERTVPDGRRAGIDTATVAGSNVNTASRTPSV